MDKLITLAELEKKTDLINSYLNDAEKRLGNDHRFYKQTLTKIERFQKKHELQVNPNTLSVSNLKEKDYEIYNNLLDSINDSKYINPYNYKEYVKQQEEIFKKEGWSTDRGSVKAYMNFRDSALFEELVNMNILPSQILDKGTEDTLEGDNVLTLNDFKKGIRAFIKSKGKTGVKLDKGHQDFVKFIDDYIKLKGERSADFDKGLKEYFSKETPKGTDLFEFFNEY